VRSSGYPELTNIHLSYQTIELFLTWPLLFGPSLIVHSLYRVPLGTAIRKAKRIPLEVPSKSCHNESMKNKNTEKAKYSIDKEIERIEDFIAWAKENFEKLSKKDQCKLENFSYDVQEVGLF